MLLLDVVWYCFFICRLHIWNWMGASWQQIAIQRWCGKNCRSVEKGELYFSFFMLSWRGQGKIYLLAFTCLCSYFHMHSIGRSDTQTAISLERSAGLQKVNLWLRSSSTLAVIILNNTPFYKGLLRIFGNIQILRSINIKDFDWNKGRDRTVAVISMQTRLVYVYIYIYTHVRKIILHF